ncbi:hypothetical protein B0A55_13593 [Friedmanniomyces simplex]|uniref:Uncharacterized protein n=1 Tax=Friedmanniomyces simplex TaxID=329884 RepID=A0A4U0UVQ1_9PEZI|nr:hypothetical protein B0A55_13593 [Friedmanniomyces simplex]
MGSLGSTYELLISQAEAESYAIDGLCGDRSHMCNTPITSCKEDKLLVINMADASYSVVHFVADWERTGAIRSAHLVHPRTEGSENHLREHVEFEAALKEKRAAGLPQLEAIAAVLSERTGSAPIDMSEIQVADSIGTSMRMQQHVVERVIKEVIEDVVAAITTNTPTVIAEEKATSGVCSITIRVPMETAVSAESLSQNVETTKGGVDEARHSTTKAYKVKAADKRPVANEDWELVAHGEEEAVDCDETWVKVDVVNMA